MDMGVLKQFLRDEALSSQILNPVGEAASGKGGAKPTTNSAAGTPSAPPEGGDKGNKPVTSHRLIMNIMIR